VQDLFYGASGPQQSPDGKLLPGNLKPIGSKDKMNFQPPTKKKIQLTFEDIVIKTIPQKRKCCQKGPVLPAKVILNNVSGTIQPGHFLAIIGASGKLRDIARVLASI
jgi:ABC-type protease/lipase transport system fused ATPase/permease subunit